MAACIAEDSSSGQRRCGEILFLLHGAENEKQHHLLLMLLIIWSPYSALSVILLYPYQASFLPRRSA